MRFVQTCCAVVYSLGVVVSVASAQGLLNSVSVPALSIQSATGNAQAQGMRADDFQRLALQRNADLMAARQDIAAARGFLTQSRLRPNPGLDVSFSSGRPLGSPGERGFDVGYAHTIELGGKRARRIDVAQVGIEVAELFVADRERLLRLDIHTRYADAQAGIRNFATLAELFELNQRSLRVAVQRVSEGEGAPLEQRLLEAEVGRIAADRFVAGGAAERALIALKTAAGIPASETLSVADELRASPLSMSLDLAVERALIERPDLKAARADEARAEAEVRLARAERVPDVIGVVRYGQNSSAFDQFGTTASGQLAPVRDTDHTLTGGVSIPLPFANRNQGAVESATARLQAAALRRTYVEQTVRGEVAAAYAQYAGARQAVEVFDQQVITQVEASVNTFRVSYELGEVQLLDLVQEQRRLIETQKAFTDALRELYVARATLDAAVGVEVK